MSYNQTDHQLKSVRSSFERSLKKGQIWTVELEQAERIAQQANDVEFLQQIKDVRESWAKNTDPLGKGTTQVFRESYYAFNFIQ